MSTRAAIMFNVTRSNLSLSLAPPLACRACVTKMHEWRRWRHLHARSPRVFGLKLQAPSAARFMQVEIKLLNCLFKLYAAVAKSESAHTSTSTLTQTRHIHTHIRMDACEFKIPGPLPLHSEQFRLAQPKLLEIEILSGCLRSCNPREIFMGFKFKLQTHTHTYAYKTRALMCSRTQRKHTHTNSTDTPVRSRVVHIFGLQEGGGRRVRLGAYEMPWFGWSGVCNSPAHSHHGGGDCAG